MRVLVLGAGVIGTTSAWFLHAAGHEVTVLERQRAAAEETSFANGGQVSVSHVEPWANPAAPLKILRWLGQPDAPLLFRPRLDPRQWRWGLQFLVECLPSRTRRNMLQILAISKYSGAALRELRASTRLSYDDLQRGILQIYTDREGFDDAAAAAELVRRYGIARELKTAEQCVALEPALAARRDWIVGATYTATDETGDARKFTQQLAALAAERGVAFRYGATIESLTVAGGSVTGVRVRRHDEGDRSETLVADAYVVCLSSHSPMLLGPIGVPALVYPAKGYSATLPIVDPAAAPTISITDDAKKIVTTRPAALRARNRRASGYGLSQSVRCGRRRAAQWSGLARDDAARAEFGHLRPVRHRTSRDRQALPESVSQHRYGTLGWTMAAGSGKALAEIVSGRRPEIGFAFLDPRAR
jgi:D-amino-acid dehydrogenase